jgi:UDP-glucose 4-epimerase
VTGSRPRDAARGPGGRGGGLVTGSRPRDAAHGPGGRPAVAVVGASGFIGARLTAALATGGTEVIRFTREAAFPGSGAGWPAPSGHGGRRAVPVVFYLATSINPAIAQRSPGLARADHDNFCRALDLMERLDQPPVVVLSSSGGTVYDTRQPPPHAESMPTRPASVYGTAKLALEAELGRRRLPAVVLRLANVYGPGQRTGTRTGVIAHWLAAAAAGQPLTIFGDPRARRDYVYVDDVVEAMIAVYDRVRADPAARIGGLPVMNIGSGVPTSLAQLTSLIQDIAGRPLLIHQTGPRDCDRRDSWLDTRAAARLLGWRARTRLADGLACTWDSSELVGHRS